MSEYEDELDSEIKAPPSPGVQVVGLFTERAAAFEESGWRLMSVVVEFQSIKRRLSHFEWSPNPKAVPQWSFTRIHCAAHRS
ncbi:hypothetical protein GRI58_06040 [Porphyrobacter algicida]|uniref:Uncharacterized protein n=1 Tax=Qipengyuania algicida TaxID=1836209 RepID=A0A845AHI0_9SPHN|nr:hypothetical protein [Qipengyuania algicida]MXP28381.1 hypothetical protein [Qipengyuania algicida]